MHFSVTHDFAAPPDAVVAVMCDPEFQSQLELPDLSKPEVVEHRVDGTACMLRLRYQYVGQLDPIARRVIGNRKLTWLQDLELDSATMRGRLTFAAEADASRLFGAADVALDAADPTRTTRRIAGDLHVKVPLIGGTAEKRIVPGLVARLDTEAQATTVELARRAQ